MATTRDSIISAAVGLLDQAGPDAVTLRAVAKIAGVSHNAPYKHFLDKEALLAAVAARELRMLGAAMSAVLSATSDPLSGLRLLGQGHIQWAMQFPYRFRLIFGRWNRQNDELVEAAENARRLFVEAVGQVRGQGAIRPGDDERTAALLMSLAHGAVDLALGGHLAKDGKGRADPGDLVEDLIAMLEMPAERV